MPIGNNRDDQQGTLQQGAAGMMGVGGPQAGTGNATKPAVKKTKGSGFVGLQSYLTNNPNAAAQATSQLQSESQGLGQKITGATGTVTGQIQGQQATGMGQQYKDVSMSPVQDLGKDEESLKNKAAALTSGDYTKFASAQGYKPMTAGEGALYGGLMGTTMAEQMPQIQQVQNQDAVGAALRGLATTQDTQRAAYNKAVQDYTNQYAEAQMAADLAARTQFAGVPNPTGRRDVRGTLPTTPPVAPATPVSNMLEGESLHAQLNALAKGDIVGATEKSLGGTATTVKDIGKKLVGKKKWF